MMSKNLKIMLFWSLLFPLIITVIRILIDYLLGREIMWFSYTADSLGIVAGGAIFAGPLMIQVLKLKEDKEANS